MLATTNFLPKDLLEKFLLAEAEVAMDIVGPNRAAQPLVWPILYSKLKITGSSIGGYKPHVLNWNLHWRV